jgi:hypothetical protein
MKIDIFNSERIIMRIEKIDIGKIHTTPMGEERILRNLGLNVENVVDWCKSVVENAPDTAFSRKGKNWYISCEDFVITINAHSYTIITAHKIKPQK